MHFCVNQTKSMSGNLNMPTFIIGLETVHNQLDNAFHKVTKEKGCLGLLTSHKIDPSTGWGGLHIYIFPRPVRSWVLMDAANHKMRPRCKHLDPYTVTQKSSGTLYEIFREISPILVLFMVLSFDEEQPLVVWKIFAANTATCPQFCPKSDSK